jgi:hypothetical protein
MGINGVSTRKVAAITEELCGTYSLHRLFLPSTRGWTLSSIAGTSRHFYTKNLDCSGKERYIKKTSRTSLAEVLLSSQFIFSRSLVFDKSRVVTGTVVLAAPAKVTVPVAGLEYVIIDIRIKGAYP